MQPELQLQCISALFAKAAALPWLLLPPLSLALPWHCRELFAALDRCESILSKQRYLLGNQLTEADVRRLFQTLAYACR